MRETLKHPRNTAKDPNNGASEGALQNMPIIMLILRASPAVLSMWPCKLFFTSKFSYLLFCNPDHKTETGIANGRGNTTIIANHLVQFLSLANQKHWTSVNSYLLHSFLQVQWVAAPFTRHRKLYYYAEPKPFSWAKPTCFDFSSSDFTV